MHAHTGKIAFAGAMAFINDAYAVCIWESVKYWVYRLNKDGVARKARWSLRHITEKNKQEMGYTQRPGPCTLRRNKKETDMFSSYYKTRTILAEFGMSIVSWINFSK